MFYSVLRILILVGFSAWLIYKLRDDIMWIIDNWEPPKDEDEK